MPIHELECIEYRVLDVVCAQHVLCVLCVGVVKDTVAQIYLQVSLKLILPATGGGGCRKQPPTLIAVVQQVCASCRCYMLLCFAPYPAGDLGGNDWNVDCEPT